jgi:DNA-binding HxlR family transcriptional regulator
VTVESTRFNEIRRGVSRISASLIESRLDAWERAGITGKRKTKDSRVLDYSLTLAGEELKPVLTGTGKSGQLFEQTGRHGR